MKKLILIIFSLVFLLSNAIANDNNIDEFTNWLLENGHSHHTDYNWKKIAHSVIKKGK